MDCEGLLLMIARIHPISEVIDLGSVSNHYVKLTL